MVALKFIFIIFCCYLVGNVSFAKIISSSMHHKDITKEGSGNPGVMNVLRTHGLKEGLIVLLCDAVKAGLPALLSYFILKSDGIADVGYFVAGLSVVLGHNFPMVFNFKGGKGVACTFGTFLFNPHFWWVSMIVFVVGFLLFLLIEYPFIISFFAITTLVVYATIFFTLNKYANLVALLIFVWLFFVLTIVMHRNNIVRLVQGKENKINFRAKVKKFFTGKKGIEIIEEDEVNIRDPKAEEIVIYDLPRAKVKTKEEIKEEEKRKKELRLKNKRKKKETIIKEPIKSASEKIHKEKFVKKEDVQKESSLKENLEDNVTIQETEVKEDLEQEEIKENSVQENVQEEQTENVSNVTEETIEQKDEIVKQEVENIENESENVVQDQEEKLEVENQEDSSEIETEIKENDSEEKQESLENLVNNEEEKVEKTVNQDESLSEELPNETKESKEIKSSKPSRTKKERKLKFYQQTSIFENRDDEEV